MIVCVNQDRCAGCGICLEDCPSGAIHIENGWAVIDQSSCTGCLTCVDVCPNGAIEMVSEQPMAIVLASQKEKMAVQAMNSRPIPIQAQTTQSNPTPTRLSGLAPIANTVLAYMGREVLPRVVNAMVSALENRVTRSNEQDQVQIEMPPRIRQNQFQGGRGRQIRHHSGRGYGRNRKGRR